MFTLFILPYLRRIWFEIAEGRPICLTLAEDNLFLFFMAKSAIMMALFKASVRFALCLILTTRLLIFFNI